MQGSMSSQVVHSRRAWLQPGLGRARGPIAEKPCSPSPFCNWLPSSASSSTTSTPHRTASLTGIRAARATNPQLPGNRTALVFDSSHSYTDRGRRRQAAPWGRFLTCPRVEGVDHHERFRNLKEFPSSRPPADGCTPPALESVERYRSEAEQKFPIISKITGRRRHLSGTFVKECAAQQTRTD